MKSRDPTRRSSFCLMLVKAGQWESFLSHFSHNRRWVVPASVELWDQMFGDIPLPVHTKNKIVREFGGEAIYIFCPSSKPRGFLEARNREIRSLYDSKVSVRELARKFMLSEGYVRHILNAEV